MFVVCNMLLRESGKHLVGTWDYTSSQFGQSLIGGLTAYSMRFLFSVVRDSEKNFQTYSLL